MSFVSFCLDKNIPFVLFSRSMRSRPGSLKGKNHYTTLKENGDLGTGLTSTKCTDDFDIKTLQQKKHEAEIRRLVLSVS